MLDRDALHDYQKYSVKFVEEHPAAILIQQMGLGKTISSLTSTLDLMFDSFEVHKTLVIAPLRVARDVWPQECRENWSHTRFMTMSVVVGDAKARVAALELPADIYVVNRENIKWLVEYYEKNGMRWDFGMVVIDELSSFKNHQSKRFKSLKLVRDKIKRIIGLTGTPAPNGLIDIWAQIYLLDKGERLERNITAFRERYFNYTRYGDQAFGTYDLKTGSEDSIQNKISDICISMKSEDYLELPDINYNRISIELDTKAKKAYNELEKEMILELIETGETIDVTSAAALTNKLLQLSNGAVYDEDRKVHEIHNCKIEAFMELVEALNGQPALVFYSFQHDKDRIKKALSKSNLRIRELKTDQDVTDWNNGKIDMLITHPASSAYGLNLQAGGNHIIWFGLNWSLELYQQANKRLHRQGQTEKVFIHHLITEGTRDQDVMAALGDKGDIQESLLNSLKARIDKYRRG